MPDFTESMVVRQLSELEARDQELREQISWLQMELRNLQAAGTKDPKIAKLQGRLKALLAQQKRVETQFDALEDL